MFITLLANPHGAPASIRITNNAKKNQQFSPSAISFLLYTEVIMFSVLRLTTTSQLLAEEACGMQRKLFPKVGNKPAHTVKYCF